ncbi:transglutaminase-like domain-containing protein [Desulfosarcina sp.]|uniref:transglutaminase-like domain-containing protein n=1 Tax=Desulfosarcina sp. TaxID=2027861 RepID=UPI003970AA1F
MGGKINAKDLRSIAIAGLTIGIILVLIKGQRLPDDNFIPNLSPKTVHYRFLIRNTTNRPVADAYFFVHAPLKQTSTQQCDHIDASHPFERVTDRLGNQLLKFTFDTFPPYASKIVSVRANLMRAPTPMGLGGCDAARFAGPAKDAHADDIALRHLASRLTSGTAHATAANLYAWVVDHIAYTGYSREAKGARSALSNRQGDCTEFADLFVALARAVDIPARRVSGYLAHENSVLRPADYHDWAEFFENGVWRIADAQQRNFDARYPDYIAMRIYDHLPPTSPIGDFQLFYVRGKGLKAKMDS